MDRSALYRTIWRWHFYAGLLVVPAIVILALTGAVYLFKPQIDRWEERTWRDLPAASVDPGAQVDAALAAFPGSRFHSYRLPQEPGDAALVHIGLPDGQAMRDVFVSPAGTVVGSLDPDRRISAVVHDVHGSLLIGRPGSWIVELAASWAIVMIGTGLYLWWPKGQGAGGVLWPRVGRGARTLLRDLHAVTGFWVAGLALVLLLTGLPWADVWGKSFRWVRAEMGWVKGGPSWSTGGRKGDAVDPHADHDHDAMLRMEAAGIPLPSMNQIVANARAEALTPPVLILPPGAPGRFGAPPEMVWTVRSDTQNRPLQVTLRYDMATGRLLSRTGSADMHPVDRVLGYGIAWHEGALFGWVNQLIGLMTALALVTLAVSGFLMWRRRKPDGVLGAPPPRRDTRKGGLVAIALTLAAFLPMLAASMVVLAIFDRALLPRLPRLSAWLGIAQPAT